MSDTALDFVAAPASQIYTERVFFSVRGMLTQGLRNRMSKSLEMRVWLKLNVKLIGWLRWQTFYPLYSDFEYIRHNTFSISCLIFYLCVDCIFDSASLNYMTDWFAASFHWIIFAVLENWYRNDWNTETEMI